MRTDIVLSMWSKLMWPRRYSVGGRNEVSTTIISLTAKFDGSNHSWRCCSVDKYSRDYLLQYNLWHYQMICHRINLLAWMSIISGSKVDCMCCSIKKWPGVSAYRSCGLGVRGVIGREKDFLDAIDQGVKFFVSQICLKWNWTFIIPDSEITPKCGVKGGMKYQMQNIWAEVIVVLYKKNSA